MTTNEITPSEKLTFGDIGVAAFFYIGIPGIMYAISAEERAKRAGVKVKESTSSTIDSSDKKFAVAMVGITAAIGGELGAAFASNSNLVMGAAVGAVAFPWGLINGLGVANGVYHDIRTLCRKAARTTTYNRLASGKNTTFSRLASAKNATYSRLAPAMNTTYSRLASAMNTTYSRLASAKSNLAKTPVRDVGKVVKRKIQARLHKHDR